MAVQPFKPKIFKGNSKSFSEINDFMNQFSTRGDLASNSKHLDIPYYIDSGSYKLNAVVSGSLLGGWAGGKIHTIAGHPKTQKSGLVLEAMANFLNMFEDAFVVMFETEGALTKERLIANGINPDRVRIERPLIVEEVNSVIIRMCKSFEASLKDGKTIPKVMVVIDSINGLLSGKQLDDALGGDIKADMGTQARELKLLFNFASKTIDKLGITMLCTAHVMERDQTVGGGAKFKEVVVSGGMGAIYFSSTILFLRKFFDRDEETKVKTGIIVTAEAIETRLCTPTKTTLKIRFKGGLNRYLGLEEHIGLQVCGIGNGRLADYYDICQELLAKKKITKEDILTSGIAIKDIEAVLSKEKRDILPFIFKKNLEQEICYLQNGEEFISGSGQLLFFTQKAFNNIDENGKYVNTFNLKVGIPSTSSNLVAEHLQRNITVPELLSDVCMTPEILEMINEKSVKPIYSYKSTISTTTLLETPKEEDDLEEFFKAGETND